MFIFLGLYGLLSFYFGFRTIAALRLPGIAAAIASIVILLFVLALPVTWIVRHKLPQGLSDAMHMLGGYYAIWMLWGVLFFLALDLTRFTSWLSGGWFLSEWQRPVTIGALALMAILTAIGTILASVPPRIRELEITVPGLPVAYDGLTITQVSDIHIGPVALRRVDERAGDAGECTRGGPHRPHGGSG